jgi:hypothetical protein
MKFLVLMPILFSAFASYAQTFAPMAGTRPVCMDSDYISKAPPSALRVFPRIYRSYKSDCDKIASDLSDGLLSQGLSSVDFDFSIREGNRLRCSEPKTIPLCEVDFMLNGPYRFERAEERFNDETSELDCDNARLALLNRKDVIVVGAACNLYKPFLRKSYFLLESTIIKL